jgi:hypothetical protein
MLVQASRLNIGEWYIVLKKQKNNNHHHGPKPASTIGESHYERSYIGSQYPTRHMLQINLKKQNHHEYHQSVPAAGPFAGPFAGPVDGPVEA